MAIYIRIKKISDEEGLRVYYEVLTNDFSGAHFYFCIDQENKQLLFFMTNDFSKIIKIINFLYLEEPIGLLEGVDQRIYIRVVMKAIKAFQENYFPIDLDYCA
jgi:hypothetical protein